MKYIFIITVAIYLSLSQVLGQINSESSFYLQHPILINPAASGLSSSTEVFLSYRDQWTGFEGAPKMFQAAIHGRLQQNTGIGMLLQSYQWGVLDDKGGSFFYAHQVDLAQEHKLRLGASTGFFQRSINFNRLDVENPDGDMVFHNHYGNDMFMQVGFGVLYHWQQLSISISSPGIYDGASQKMFSKNNIWVAYHHKIPSSAIVITPSIQYRSNKTNPSLIHMAIQGAWKDIVWLQAGYKTNKNLLFSTGLKYDKLGFGYSFEHNNQILSHFSYGSHEILLSYLFSSIEKKERRK